MGKDLCLTCGKEVPSGLWGGKCEAGHTTVHYELCSICGESLMGTLGSDDYCGLDIIVCQKCMELAYVNHGFGSTLKIVGFTEREEALEKILEGEETNLQEIKVV